MHNYRQGREKTLHRMWLMKKFAELMVMSLEAPDPVFHEQLLDAARTKMLEYIDSLVLIRG